jgi:hypothetical protein
MAASFMKKAFFPFLALAGFLMSVDHSQAGLGWSYDECILHYGQTTEPNFKMDDGHIACHFAAQGYQINAYFLTNTVSRIAYRRDFAFDTPAVEDFLAANGTGATWKGPYHDTSNGSSRWYGMKDGEVAYVASLNPDGLALIIWTKVDDDFAAARDTQKASGL